MARAHYAENVVGTSGGGSLSLLSGATVHVYDQGTTDHIAQTIYDSDAGVGTLSNPLTSDANGKIEFWLNDPARVDLAISKVGFTSQTRTVDVEAAASGGGSGPQLVGPFEVAYDTANLTNGATAGIHLVDLAAGTLVVQAWAFITTSFDDGIGSANLHIVVGDPSGDWDVLIAYFIGAPYPASAGIALEPQLDSSKVPAPRRVMRANVAGSLRAWVPIGGEALTAGHAEVYALIVPPS